MPGRRDARSPDRMWLGLLLAFAVAGAAAAWPGLHAAAPAPPFSLVSTGLEPGAGGEPARLSLSDYAGRTVVLDLMAVTCIPCQQVTEDVLKPLWQRHAGGDFAILSIDTWADPDSGGALGGETAYTLGELQARSGAAWPHALDTDDVWRKYDAAKLPRLVVVAPDGNIVLDTTRPTLAAVEAAVQASFASAAPGVPALRVGLPGLAAAVGLAALATPCAAALLAGHRALLLRDPAAHPAPARLRRAARGGLGAAAGLLVAVVALGLAVERFEPLPSKAAPALQALHLPVAAPVLVAVVGVLFLLAVLARRTPAAPAHLAVHAALGLLLGLAIVGWSPQAIVRIWESGFRDGWTMGLATVVAFAAVAAAAAFLLALLAGRLLQGRRAERLARWARPAQAAAGALMLVAGLATLVGPYRLA